MVTFQANPFEFEFEFPTPSLKNTVLLGHTTATGINGAHRQSQIKGVYSKG